MLVIERLHIEDINIKMFYKKFRKNGVPVIITGVFDNIPSWSLEHLSQWLSGGKYYVREFNRQNKTPKYLWTSYSDIYQMAFDDYRVCLANGIANKRDIYMSQVMLPADHGLIKSVSSNIGKLTQACGLKKRTWKSIYSHLWLGPKGHVEPLHSDEGDGTLCQLYGSKRVVLFPSWQNNNLYPFPFFSKIEPWICQADINNIDLNRFPKLERALHEKLEVTITKGEILYLPAQWSHEVSIVDEEYACSLSMMWDIPFHRNFISKRTVVWYLLRCSPDGLKKWIYYLYYKLVK